MIDLILKWILMNINECIDAAYIVGLMYIQQLIFIIRAAAAAQMFFFRS
jgi:hypothetical protein